MKANTIIYIAFVLFSAFCVADDVVGAGCSAAATIAPRASASWTNSDGSINQIYDVTVMNSGTCPLDNIGLNFGLPSGSSITSMWNLEAEELYVLLSNFGSSLAVGASATAGFILNMPAGSTQVAVNVYGAACPSACVNAAPTSSAPTSAPTSAPSAPTAAPTTSSSAPYPQCEGNARAVLRNQPSWQDAQGYTYQIYDIIANNTGTCPWTTIAAYFAGNITSSWNYDIPSGLLSGFGTEVQAGSAFTGAGFVFAIAPTPVAGYPSTPVLGRMVNRCSAPCPAGDQ